MVARPAVPGFLTMKPFQDYADQFPQQDPLETIRNYGDEVKLDLLRNGEYDDEIVGEVDNALFEKAQAQGLDLGDDPAAAFTRPRGDQDLDILATYSLDDNARQAAAELRALKTAKDLYGHDPSEYQSKLEAAELNLANAATPEVRNHARKEALTSGNVPYIKYQDADGNPQMELSPELAAFSGNDAALAKMFEANPNLDRSDIPVIRQRLAVPEGYDVPAFVLDRKNDFSQAVASIATRDPSVAANLNRLRTAIDAGNDTNLDPLLADINSSLGNHGISGEFSPEERKNFLKDYVVALSSPAVDDTNVDANLKKLSTGEVHVPFGVFLNKPLFDKTMAESKVIPASQKEALIASRDARLEGYARDVFPLLTSRNPEFATFYDKAKGEGKSDAAILDTFMANPENRSAVRDFTEGTVDSLVEGFGGLALYPLALAGNETARDVISGLQQQDSDRRQYAQLFGKNLGVGYDLTRLVAPVAADVGVSLLTSGAAAGLVGAKTTARAALKSTLATALKSETKSLARSFAESAAQRQGADLARHSLNDVLSLAGRDIAEKFTQSATTASYLATAFNRSAGSTYVQLHNTLEKQKNPDGSPKYTPEQAREIALNHGLLAGTITAAVTGGFSFLGAAGTERIYEGMTRRQLNGVFDRLKRDWGKLAPEVREGLDMTSANAMLSSVVRKSMVPVWESVGRPIAEEGAEEGLDEFLNYFNQQIATGDKINIADAAKQAGYAAMLGGAMGGTVTGINSVARGADVAPNDETAVRRQTLLDTARKLDAAHSPETATVLRRLAAAGIPTRPEESVPQGSDTPGDVEAPSGQSVAEPEAVTGFRSELAQLAEALPVLQEIPEGESAGQKARREQRLAQSQARATELTGLIDNYDASTIEAPLAPEQRTMRKEDPGTTVLPSGPTIELAAAPVQFAQAPGVIGEIDQMPERDGQPTTRWTASDGLGQAEGIIEDGVLTISNIEAKARGTKFLDRVIAQSPVTEISVPLQSPRMQAAVKKLVDSGVLTNPAEPRGVEKYPTRFTVVRPDASTNPDAMSAGIPADPQPKTKEQLDTELDQIISRYKKRTGPEITLDPIDLKNPDRVYLEQLPLKHPDRVLLEPLDLSELALYRKGLTTEGNRILLERIQLDPRTTSDAELDVADIFYEPGPGDAPAEVAATLNAEVPEQAIAANRADVDAFLQSKGIVTEGLSDADAAVLLGASRREQPAASQTNVAAELAGLSEGVESFLRGVKGPLQPAAKLLLRFPPPQVTMVDLPGASFAGAYVPSTGQVLINTAKSGPRGPVDTVIHELLHAATEASILNPTPEQAAILKRLDRIRQSVLKKSKGDAEISYATGSNSEFVTHVFTSPEFLRRVGEMTPKGDRNWVQVIIDTIKDLLNGRARTQSERISESVMVDMVKLVESVYPSRMDQVIANPRIAEVRQQPASDEAYLDAVQRGDTATAQRMVDEAAKAAGYNTPKLQHWTDAEFDQFEKRESHGFDQVDGFWFNDSDGTKSPFGSRKIDAYLRLENPKVYETAEAYDEALSEGSTNNLQEQGYDGVIIKPAEEWMGSQEWDFTNYVAFDPSQIKSADPVTYDAQGNVIPLSQRFDDSTPDIRFQPEADQTFTPASVRQLAESFAPEGVELTIDFGQLADDLDGITGVNAEDLVSAMVNRDVARQAGLAALGDDVTAEEAERLADTFVKTITGNMPDSDIAFYRSNPTARDRLVRYLQGAVNALWERLKVRFDPRTGMAVDRIAREVALAKDGYRTRSQVKQFDPNNPEETASMLRYQPAAGDSPEYKYTNFATVNDGSALYTRKAGDEKPKGWLARLFTRRDDMAKSQSAIKVDRTANFNVIEEKFARLNPLYDRAIKKENPNMDLVKQAIGSTAPLLTPDEETRINTEVESRLETASNLAAPRIAAARAVKDKEVRQARRANSKESEDAAMDKFHEVERQANATQARAVDAVMEWERNEVNKSKVARASELRRVQGLAMQQLEVNAPLTHKWASEMRETTNEFQRMLTDIYRESRPELSNTIDQSNGVYLVRSYAFHQEPAMAEMILHDPKFDDLRERAIGHFGAELSKDEFARLKGDPAFKNTPEDDLAKVARQNVEDQARRLFEDFIAGHESAYTSPTTANNIRTEFMRFAHKKNLDPVISELLGEIEDPNFNMGRTLSAVSGIVFTQKALAAFKKEGLDSGTIVTKEEKEANPTKYRNWEPLVAANAHSQAFAPLAGFFAAPEDAMAFDAAFNASRAAAKDSAGQAADTLNKLILGMAGASLGVATLSSPGFFSRNVLGNTLMTLAQGVNPFSADGKKSIKAAFDKAYHRDGGDQEFIEKMLAFRVLGDGTQITYLRDFLTRYRQDPLGALDWAAEKGMKISPEAVKALGKGKAGWSKMVEFLGQTAEFTETMFSPVIYLNELNALMESGLYPTKEAAEQEAARRTKMVTSSKSENPQAIAAFTKHPVSALLAPFVSFKAQMVRTVWNTYKLGIEDVKRGRAENNDVLLKHGQKRLASAAAIHAGVTVAVPLILQQIMGFSDDEDKAIRAALPSYSKNSQFWLFPTPDGFQAWDLTFANPFSIIGDGFTQSIRALRSGDFKELPQIAQRFVTEEFIGENIVASNVFDAQRNKDESTGMPIWLDSDDYADKLFKGSMHILEGSYTPTIAKKIAQAYQATNRPQKEDEDFWWTPAGVMLGAVAPVKPRSYKTEDLAYRAFRNLSKENSQLWQITGKLSSPAGMAEGEAAKLYQDRVDAGVKVWSRAHQLAKAYQSMDIPENKILSIMQDAGLSKERSIKALRGFTDRPVLPADKLKDIRKIDERRHDELIGAMRSQPRIIDVR